MRSLRRQLTIALLFASTLLLGGGGALVYWAVRESLYTQFDDALRLKALVVVTDTQISQGRVRVRFSDRFLREFDRTVATDFFQVFDEEGKSVAKSDSIGDWRLPGKLRGTVENPVFWNLTLPDRAPGRAVGIAFRPRTRADEASQELTVVVAANRLQLVQTLDRLRTVLSVCGLILLAITGLVVPLLLQRHLRPLGEMGARTATIDATSLSQRFPLENLPEELRPIAGKLNDLLARLEASFERERRFSADLAHELRTPLAELRSQAELALKWPEERTAETDRTVLEITMQLDMLVSRLLALSRAEHASQNLQRSQVHVANLVDELFRRLESRISDKRLRIRSAVAPESLVLTDPVLFESIVSNLIENAISYAPPESSVTLDFASDEKGFSLSVTNSAPDLRPDDVQRMFDRFWRKDSSRTGVAHSGLGLSLSRSFAQVLGLKLNATLDGRGNVTLMLRS